MSPPCPATPRRQFQFFEEKMGKSTRTGNYQIRVRGSRKCLDISDTSFLPANNVIVNNCHTVLYPPDSQLWQFVISPQDL
jgi:hypothetical protein